MLASAIGPRLERARPPLRSWREFTVSFPPQPYLWRTRVRGESCVNSCADRGACARRRFGPSGFEKGLDHSATCGLRVHKEGRLVNVSVSGGVCVRGSARSGPGRAESGWGGVSVSPFLSECSCSVLTVMSGPEWIRSAEVQQVCHLFYTKGTCVCARLSVSVWVCGCVYPPLRRYLPPVPTNAPSPFSALLPLSFSDL